MPERQAPKRPLGLSSRLSRPSRRGLVLALLVAVAVALGFSQRNLARRVVAEQLGVEFKHRLIAIYGWTLLDIPHDTADLVPIANADVRPYGINVFFEQEVEEAKIRRSMELIRAAGFGWIKQQVVWGEIEVPAKGQYGQAGETWAKYDRIVRLANEYGLGVILRLDTSPSWARPDNLKLETPPYFDEDYADFVGTIVARYRGKVSHYQIWNEPNLAFEWGGGAPDPAGYVRLLRLANQRAKEVDPGSVIIAAALAPTIEESDVGLNDLKYLQAMYDQGARGSFDVMSTNAYGLRHGPDDQRLNMETDVNFSRPILMRELMVRNGDADKPIWAAEVGWNALPADFGEAPRYGTVSRATQARYSARAYERADEEWPWMPMMNLWHFRMVNPKDVIQQQYYFNAVAEDFSPYPVYYSMQAQATATPILGRGYHQETHYALVFAGGWAEHADSRASLGGYQLSTGRDARLSFEFTGNRLDLVVPRGPTLGRLAVKIDGSGRLADALPRAGGQSILDEQTPATEWQARVPVVRALAAGKHTVTIEPAAGLGTAPIAIDAIVVDGPWPRDLAHEFLAELGLLAAGFGTLVVARARAGGAAGIPDARDAIDTGTGGGA